MVNKKEQREIDLLKGKGFEFKTILFGKVKSWRTKKMSLYRLVDLSDEYIKMEIDEEKISSDDYKEVIKEQYHAVLKNARRAAKILAICVADGKIKRWLLQRHFLKRIDSEELKDITHKILKSSDYQNFMISIVLMNGNRITKAKTVEKQA